MDSFFTALFRPAAAVLAAVFFTTVFADLPDPATLALRAPAALVDAVLPPDLPELFRVDFDADLAREADTGDALPAPARREPANRPVFAALPRRTVCFRVVTARSRSVLDSRNYLQTKKQANRIAEV